VNNKLSVKANQIVMKAYSQTLKIQLGRKADDRNRDEWGCHDNEYTCDETLTQVTKPEKDIKR